MSSSLNNSPIPHPNFPAFLHQLCTRWKKHVINCVLLPSYTVLIASILASEKSQVIYLGLKL